MRGHVRVKGHASETCEMQVRNVRCHMRICEVSCEKCEMQV